MKEIDLLLEDIKSEIIRNRDRDISGDEDVDDFLAGYRTGFNESLAIIDSYTERRKNEPCRRN